MIDQGLMAKIVSLCKRRGFVFQSSEIYGGLKSCYDYGPLGVELKKNIAEDWWKATVYERQNVYGMDASILMHTDVWKASGHLDNFNDPLVDCYDCHERFRGDKAPKRAVGETVHYKVKKSPNAKAEKREGVVGEMGYVCPNCGSPRLSPERQFNGMFRTHLGPVDRLGAFVDEIHGKSLSKEELQKKLAEAVEHSAVYLRPETAQAMFVQFLNVQQTMSAKVPFGIAQHGKAFRNEIVVEHFVFRTGEFEQMEVEFFCEPGSQGEWLDYWKEERIKWHQDHSNHPENFRLRQHASDELAHYSDNCFDVEYLYPWGWDELEGVASRTDYDLKKHAAASGTKLSYFDQNKLDPKTGKKGWRYTPYVIEPSLGLTRTFLSVLLDAYTEEKSIDSKGAEKTRVFLRLHPKFAPYKAAILPLVKKDGLPEKGLALADDFRKHGLNVRYDDMHSIGKRYSRHDEVGTPFCITIDNQSLDDGSVTVRDRDTTEQSRVPMDRVVALVQERLKI